MVTVEVENCGVHADTPPSNAATIVVAVCPRIFDVTTFQISPPPNTLDKNC